MNTSAIPLPIRRKAAKLYRANPTIGHVADIPESAIEAVTVDGPRARFKGGLKAWIVGGSERVVYLGAEHTETTLPEFTLLLESGAQALCQYGRDFRFPV